MDELRREPQDQPDLVDHPGGLDGVDHSLGDGAVDRQRLLAEHGEPTLGRRGHEALVLRGPRRDEHGVDPIEQLVLADRLGADTIGERLCPVGCPGRERRRCGGRRSST